MSCSACIIAFQTTATHFLLFLLSQAHVFCLCWWVRGTHLSRKTFPEYPHTRFSPHTLQPPCQLRFCQLYSVNSISVKPWWLLWVYSATFLNYNLLVTLDTLDGATDMALKIFFEFSSHILLCSPTENINNSTNLSMNMKKTNICQKWLRCLFSSYTRVEK